jgi:hypothetical protein
MHLFSGQVALPQPVKIFDSILNLKIKSFKRKESNIFSGRSEFTTTHWVVEAWSKCKKEGGA